jgi:tRNA threonylcarbamoyladenosine biosynthesis protein TsaB
MSAIWHLAIECSSVGGSVALFQLNDGHATLRLHRQTILPSDQGSVRTLAPAIDELLNAAGLRPDDLKNLSVTVGPGSFTGLRVGLATAKMLAMACRKEIVPVDTLAAIAARFVSDHAALPSGPFRLVTAMNAFRKQVFTASWLIDRGHMQLSRPACVVDAHRWQSDPWGGPAANGSHQGSAEELEVWITGSALASYAHPTANQRCHIAPAEIWQPLAEQVGQLGWQGYLQGKQLSAKDLTPNYIRASAAEEKKGTAN